MDTLYELLGALPRDDADSLRTAFRKAVKGTHPDLKPDDPDAAVKFRQIVRANEILNDPEQKAAYDHLLSLAQIEKSRALAHPIASKIHKVASGVMAVASASIVTVGGYLIFMHVSMSMALIAPTTQAASAHNSDNNTDLTSRVSASIAAVSWATAPDPAAVNALIAKSTAPTDKSMTPAEPSAPVMASTEPTPESETMPVTVTLPEVAPAYASVYHATRVYLPRGDDPEAASADLEQAILLDPNLLVSYAQQGIPFYPAVKSEYVFADPRPIKRAEKSGHARVALTASARRTEAEALPAVVPLPVPRPRIPLHLYPRRPWYASANATFQ